MVSLRPVPPKPMLDLQLAVAALVEIRFNRNVSSGRTQYQKRWVVLGGLLPPMTRKMGESRSTQWPMNLELSKPSEVLAITMVMRIRLTEIHAVHPWIPRRAFHRPRHFHQQPGVPLRMALGRTQGPLDSPLPLWMGQAKTRHPCCDSWLLLNVKHRRLPLSPSPSPPPLLPPPQRAVLLNVCQQVNGQVPTRRREGNSNKRCSTKEPRW
jgi:hypothetical protein